MLSTIFTPAALGTLVTGVVVGAFIRAPLQDWFMTKYNKHVKGGKTKLTIAQIHARDGTEPHITKAIKNAFSASPKLEYIYFQTSDRLFFMHRDDKDPVVLNLENKESHYLQTRIKHMSLDDGHAFLKKATANDGFDPHADVPYEEELYYLEHAKMNCSIVSQDMSDPENIRESAKNAITFLEALIEDPDITNRSTGNTIIVSAIEIGDKKQNMIVIKPFSQNVRQYLERQGVTRFRTLPAEMLLEGIAEYRSLDLAQFVEHRQNRERAMENALIYAHT
ncbi:MAG: hypothetical protein AB8B83_07570 [Bdellovibrionales bacterium]